MVLVSVQVVLVGVHVVLYSECSGGVFRLCSVVVLVHVLWCVQMVLMCSMLCSDCVNACSVVCSDGVSAVGE